MANDIYEKILNALKERFGADYSLKLNEFPKNNVVKTGIIVRKNGVPYAPIIYLDGVDYGEYEFSHVIDGYEKIIEDAFEQASTFERTGGLYDNLKSLDFVKSNIRPALLSKQGNKSYIENYVTRDFVGGLAMFYTISIDGTRFAYVTKSLLSLWNTSEEELYDWAMANAQFEVTDINEFIAVMARREMKAQGMPDELIEEAINSMLVPIPDELRMYVISNKSKCHGAAAMLSNDLLNEVSAKLGGSDLYIIPSSIHEIIAVSADGDSEIFKEMIKYVNTNKVKPEERLSDNLFYFDAKKMEVRLADEVDNEPIDLANVAI